MNRKLALIVGGGIILAVFAAFFVFGNDSSTELPNGRVKFKEMRVKRGMFRIAVSATGQVKPIDRVEIKSKASGTVEELPIEEGDVIKKGSLIARLDQKDEKANLEQAQANLDIAVAELKQAQHTFDRRNQLHAKGLISEEELGEIELNLAVAKGKVIQARTALERAQERLSEAVVRAPIGGVILQKYVEEGQIIASGVSNVSGGTPIADIADMRSVYIEAGVDEIDIGKIVEGQTASVIADAYPQLRFNGKIVRIAPEAVVEQNVTLFNVVVEVENTARKLKSGMNANVEITVVEEEDVLFAPAITLKVPERGRAKAKPNIRFAMVKQGGEFVRQKVEIGQSNFRETTIVSGLQEGDVLGVPLQSRLKDENDRRERRIKSSRSFGS